MFSKYYGESNNGKDVRTGQEATLEMYEPTNQSLFRVLRNVRNWLMMIGNNCWVTRQE